MKLAILVITFNYKNFTKKQIKSLKILSKFLIKKYKINKKNILGHSDIAPDRKKDPGEKFPWKYLAKFKISKWHKLNHKKLFLKIEKKINSFKKNFFLKFI